MARLKLYLKDKLYDLLDWLHIYQCMHCHRWHYGMDWMWCDECNEMFTAWMREDDDV